MRRANTIKQDLTQVTTIEELTDVFESIASIRIAKIRNRVVASKAFFAELWKIYQSMRVNPRDHLSRLQHKRSGRGIFLAVTAEGKLSGGIDEQIINSLLNEYKNPDTTDIAVIGSHGLSLLQHHVVPVVQSFPLPASDVNFSVSAMIDALSDYSRISVFYQTYDSLRVQKVARIELLSAVRELSENINENVEVVSSRDYIFEPSVDKITDYLESVMFGVALIQVIMESKLAQYASRFNTMSRAKQRAGDLTHDYRTQFYRAKRAESDERVKEALKMRQVGRAMQ
jgi:F-type H+-transporting ATPase subunit gamma